MICNICNTKMKHRGSETIDGKWVWDDNYIQEWTEENSFYCPKCSPRSLEDLFSLPPPGERGGEMKKVYRYYQNSARYWNLKLPFLHRVKWITYIDPVPCDMDPKSQYYSSINPHKVKLQEIDGELYKLGLALGVTPTIKFLFPKKEEVG